MKLARPAPRRTGRNLIPAIVVLIAGALAGFGQVPWGQWALAVLAFAVILRVIARTDGAGARFWLGLLAGAGYFAVTLNWITQPFLVEADVYGWMAPFALVAMACGMALFWAVAAWVSGWIGARTVGLIAALTGAELLRGYILTGFPWAMIGHIWIGLPPGQLAALAGAGGLTLYTLAIAGALSRARGGAMVGAALLLIAGFSFGLWRMMGPDPAAQGALLRLVQPNAAQSMKWDETRADEFFSRLTDLSAAPGAPDLVIWPETAVPYLLDYEPWVAPAIGASGQGAPVIAGIQRLEEARYFNSLALIRPDGTLGVGYDKHHLVPFGEYVPFGDLAYDWFGLTAFASKAGQVYSAGPGVQVLDLGQGRGHGLGHVLPLICYEAVFPQDLRGTSRPDWLLQITNDAWFGTQSGPFQHAAQARLRAIETGLPLVRVGNTGVTAVYDAKGRVLDSLPFDVAGKLDVTLPAAMEATPYARWGEWPVMILLLLFLLVGGLPVWRRT